MAHPATLGGVTGWARHSFNANSKGRHLMSDTTKDEPIVKPDNTHITDAAAGTEVKPLNTHITDVENVTTGGTATPDNTHITSDPS